MLPLNKYMVKTPPSEAGHTWLMRNYGKLDMAFKIMLVAVLFLALEI